MFGGSGKTKINELEAEVAEYIDKYKASKRTIKAAQKEIERIDTIRETLEQENEDLRQKAIECGRLTVVCGQLQNTVNRVSLQLTELTRENADLKRQLASALREPPRKVHKTSPDASLATRVQAVSIAGTPALTPTIVAAPAMFESDEDEDEDDVSPWPKAQGTGRGKAGRGLDKGPSRVDWAEIEEMVVAEDASPHDLQKVLRDCIPNRTPFRPPLGAESEDLHDMNAYNFYLNCDLFSGRIDTVNWLLRTFNFRVQDLFRDRTKFNGAGLQLVGPANAIGPVMRMIMKETELDDAHIAIFVGLMSRVHSSSSLSFVTVQEAMRMAAGYQPPAKFRKIISAFRHIDQRVPYPPICSMLNRALDWGHGHTPTGPYYGSNVSSIEEVSDYIMRSSRA